jgi:hypothetical protein
MSCGECERAGRLRKETDEEERREESEETILNIADFAFPKRNTR